MASVAADMRNTDIEVEIATLHWGDAPVCLITGQPADPRDYTLRRMYLVIVFFLAESVRLRLPTAVRRHLVSWQYLRLARPWFAAVASFVAMPALAPGGSDTLPIVIRLTTAFVVFTIVWVGLGYLLKRGEFVRLICLSRDRTKARLRFSSVESAERAKRLLEASKPRT